jgi:hypothetical protein
MLLSVIRHDWLEILINSYLKVEMVFFGCIISVISFQINYRVLRDWFFEDFFMAKKANVKQKSMRL